MIRPRAVQPQAGAGGCPARDHEAPQLSLNVGQISMVGKSIEA
jgi:hypothetical protein